MKTHKNFYHRIYNLKNLSSAYKKARKGKTKKLYVLEFEENLLDNLQEIQFELMTEIYTPMSLKTFILRDPKTRKISQSAFRDRIVHHALINIIQDIFEKSFFMILVQIKKEKEIYLQLRDLIYSREKLPVI